MYLIGDHYFLFMKSLKNLYDKIFSYTFFYSSKHKIQKLRKYFTFNTCQKFNFIVTKSVIVGYTERTFFALSLLICNTYSRNRKMHYNILKNQANRL